MTADRDEEFTKLIAAALREPYSIERETIGSMIVSALFHVETNTETVVDITSNALAFLATLVSECSDGKHSEAEVISDIISRAIKQITSFQIAEAKHGVKH